MNLCLSFTLHNLQVYGMDHAMSSFGHMPNYPVFEPYYDSSVSSAACFWFYFYEFCYPSYSSYWYPCFWPPFSSSWKMKKVYMNWPTVANAGIRPQTPARSCSGHWSAWSPRKTHCRPSCARPVTDSIEFLKLILEKILPWGKGRRWGGGLGLPSSWKECGHPQCQRESLLHPEQGILITEMML